MIKIFTIQHYPLLFKFSVDFVYLHVKSMLANIVLCQKAGYIFPPYFWRFHCAELTLLPLMCLLNCLAASSRRCAASAATRPASAASTASAAAATRPQNIWQPASFILVLKNVIEHVIVDEESMFCQHEHSCAWTGFYYSTVANHGLNCRIVYSYC